MEVPTGALWGKQKDGDLHVEICIYHEQGKTPMTTAITPSHAGCPEGQQPVNPTRPVCVTSRFHSSRVGIELKETVTSALLPASMSRRGEMVDGKEGWGRLPGLCSHLI